MNWQPFLVFLHKFWLVVITISCIGATVDLGFAASSSRGFVGFIFLMTPIWLSLDLYLYGSLCTLLNHVPKHPLLARAIELHHRIFTRARTGAGSLIALSILWLLTLPGVFIAFWVFLFFQVPSWWNRWMLKGVPAWVVVPYVLFVCFVMTMAWGSCMIWVFVRAIKAFWSVRFVLDDIATEEERSRLYVYEDEDDDVVSEDLFAPVDTKKGPTVAVELV